MDQTQYSRYMPTEGVRSTDKSFNLPTNTNFGSRKVFQIDQGKYCNYSVSYAQLVNEQQKNRERKQQRQSAYSIPLNNPAQNNDDEEQDGVGHES